MMMRVSRDTGGTGGVQSTLRDLRAVVVVVVVDLPADLCHVALIDFTTKVRYVPA